MNETVRKNITVSKELGDWLVARSKKYGMTQSSIIAMALADVIRNEETLKTMGNLPEIMSKLQEIQNKQSELQAEAPRPVLETK